MVPMKSAVLSLATCDVEMEQCTMSHLLIRSADDKEPHVQSETSSERPHLMVAKVVSTCRYSMDGLWQIFSCQVCSTCQLNLSY